MVRKPDFFIVGAAKSGTTSLYHYLKQHPQIWMPDLKEPHFFGEYRPSAIPILALNEYLNLFSNAPIDSKVGEASTGYLYSPSAAQQIQDFQPSAKIIIILRNPIDRAYSHYWHHVRDGFEKLSFEDAIAQDFIRTGKNNFLDYSYIHQGLYANQIKRYLERFANEKIKIFTFEELKLDALKLCNEVFGFLEISSNYNIKTQIVLNKSGPTRSKFLFRLVHEKMLIKELLKPIMPYSIRFNVMNFLKRTNVSPVPPMQSATRRQLQDFFKTDILELQLLIKKDLSHWLVG